MKRPHQQGPKNRLAEDLREFDRRQVVTDFAALLAEFDHLAMQSQNAFLHIEHGFSDRRTREIAEQQRADDGRVAHRFLRHPCAQRAQVLQQGRWAVTRLLNRIAQLRQLHLAKSEKDVVFARKIIKEGSFADVGRLRDVFDRRFRKTLLRKKIESRTEKPFAEFEAASFASRSGGRRSLGGHNDLNS